MPLSFRGTGHPAWIVLLSITFFARRDELWGRFLTCGGLLIRLPHLYAPATALENRHHSLRLCRYAGQDGILRATQRVPLPTCPTTSVEFPFLGKLSGIGFAACGGLLTRQLRRLATLPRNAAYRAGFSCIGAGRVPLGRRLPACPTELPCSIFESRLTRPSRIPST